MKNGVQVIKPREGGRERLVGVHVLFQQCGKCSDGRVPRTAAGAGTATGGARLFAKGVGHVFRVQTI